LRVPWINRSEGFTVVECVVATVLISVLMLALLPVLNRTNAVREQVDRQTYAIQYLRNLTERGLFATEQTDPELSPEVQDILPEAQLLTERTPEPTGGTRVSLTLQWSADSGVGQDSATLHYWLPVATGGAP
jgi:type II secretory pathway pseudopilin PulG